MTIDIYQKKTRYTLFLYHLLGEPLFTVYGFIPFILRKNLEATAFQIVLLTMLKPLVSILSFYWSINLREKKQKLRANLWKATLFARAPFLLFPFLENRWFLIGASAIYFLFSRAATPAWMEILKLNLPQEKRGKSFSWSYALSYLEGMVLSFAVGALLDHNPSLWKNLCFLSSFLGMFSIGFILWMPINQEIAAFSKAIDTSWKERVIKPWKNACYLMKTRPDFSLFQWGFMLCGFGIMLIQPAVPLWLNDTLQFSCMEYGLATSICKGCLITLSSPIWGRWLHKVSIFQMSQIVFGLVALFLGFLVFSVWHPFWVYLGFCLYGVAQGGSHLIWNLSGVHFSGKEESSLFSGVNVVMVGIRGAIAPLLGGILISFLSPIFVFFLGTLFCIGSVIILRKKKILQTIS